MNIYSVVLTGDLAAQSAADQSNFIGFISSLFATAVNHTIFYDGAVLKMQFETEYKPTVPASVVGVVTYHTVAIDTRSNKVLTTIDKPTLWKGDVAFIVSALNHDQELEDNVQITLPSGLTLYIGQAADSQTDFYTPFTGAVVTRIFDRAKLETIQAELQFTTAAEANAMVQNAVSVLNS